MDAAVGGPGFEPWVLARRASMLRTAWLLTGDGAAAEDLVQTALVRCWPRWRRIRRMDDIDAYVRKVMTNTYLSWRGRRWTGEQPTEQLPEVAAADVSESDATLVAALARLPRGQRAAVVLRFAEDLSERQTAELMGCSVGTVKSQTARGLAALRRDPSVSEVDRT